MLKKVVKRGFKVDLPKSSAKVGKKPVEKLPSDKYLDEVTPIDIKVSDTTKVVLSVKREASEGLPRLDIREYVTTPKYTGFTKKGVNIPLEVLPSLVAHLTALSQDPKIGKMIDDMLAVTEEDLEGEIAVKEKREWKSLLKLSTGRLSAKIDYSMSKEDIETLAELYQEGYKQQEILDVLEDINYHTEYAYFADENWDELQDFLDTNDMWK